MSGSTTPTSAGSYTDAQVREQSVWQAVVNKLKAAQLDELLGRKGIKPKGVKAEKAMEVAWQSDGRGSQALGPPLLGEAASTVVIHKVILPKYTCAIITYKCKLPSALPQRTYMGPMGAPRAP